MHFIFVDVCDSYGTAMHTTEVLDVNKISFEPGPVMKMGFQYCTAVALEDHSIVILGGRVSNRDKLVASILAEQSTGDNRTQYESE